MKRTLLYTLLCTFVIIVAGCQSNLKYETEMRKVTIKTDPYNAKVYQINPIDKHIVFLGYSPVKDQPVNVINNFTGAEGKDKYDFLTTQLEMVNVKIEKDGYKTYIGNLATDKKDTLSHRVELEKQ